MTALAERIYNEVLDLPTDERLSLIDRLLHMNNLSTQKDIDQSWIDEAARRDQQVDNGTVSLIPGEEVVAKINKRLSE
ncbi:addiction module protein [Pontiella sulfatireligans]|uniref:Addiction module component n=1 Tax=Pontiella sulfatireligans TaxID=2750658 RepID=A0A6C2UPM4_9BACT|nr:addiction module protein [Pontiella sulfatireligans]VGO21267.1 hypothetical protein SCARR_03339 [Pontiella sulfatireligans]